MVAGLAVWLSACAQPGLRPAEDSGAPAPPTAAAPPVEKLAPPRAQVPNPPPPYDQALLKDGLTNPGPAPVVLPTDVLERIRLAMLLEQSDNAAVQRELAWYARHPDYMERVFGRAQRYLHHIVEALDERQMPLDLALLPVVESAFDPFAYSHGRAAGLWQIIPGTGRRLGLKQDWWYDGRRDVVESTRAALDYLESLHQMFDGDWLLAVAGYNSGPGNVSRALKRARRAGEPTDFWHISAYLPRETRTYVPRLLAVARLVADPAAHGISLPEIPNTPYFAVIDTGGQIDMTLAAELASLSTDQLYELNAGVNRWATDPAGPHRLLLPFDSGADFSAALAELGERDRVEWTRHQIKNGESLSQIARRYRTTVEVLKEVNGLRGNMIRAGQALMVPHAVADLRDYSQSQDQRAARQQARGRDGQRYAHVVQPGETLWAISRRYAVSTRELASWNAMAPGDVLSVGRELVVWTDNAPALQSSNERIRRLTYTVRRGDSLSRISRRFRVSVGELQNWNSLSADRYLQPGQQITVYVNVTEQST